MDPVLITVCSHLRATIPLCGIPQATPIKSYEVVELAIKLSLSAVYLLVDELDHPKKSVC
jgi:hypothetical protein